jgi:hypothetical protein
MQIMTVRQVTAKRLKALTYYLLANFLGDTDKLSGVTENLQPFLHIQHKTK